MEVISNTETVWQTYLISKEMAKTLKEAKRIMKIQFPTELWFYEKEPRYIIRDDVWQFVIIMAKSNPQPKKGDVK